MSERTIDSDANTVESNHEPLIGVVVIERGREVVRYFSSEAAADAALGEEAENDALLLAGAWSELSWEQMDEALSRIRHDTPPSPSLSL